MSELQIIAQKTQSSSLQLAILNQESRNQALEAIASALDANQEEIVKANELDCQEAEGTISSSLFARLKLGQKKLQGAIVGIRDLIKLDDPIGLVSLRRELDEGLIMERVSCPVGVLGVIFEARPDALIQIVSLAIKSGNGVILKGGKEALNTCTTLIKIIHQALTNTEVSPD